jgi:rubrerythrin
MTENNPEEISDLAEQQMDYSEMFLVSDEEVSQLMKMCNCSIESQNNEWQCPICLSLV